jgi:hypothetical protein
MHEGVVNNNNVAVINKTRILLINEQLKRTYVYTSVLQPEAVVVAQAHIF